VLYKVILMVHMLGASVWIGGHAVLMGIVLPKAIRENDPRRVQEFERGYGRLGLAALVAQVLTGPWLATRWIGDWTTIFSEPTPQSHLVLSKITVLLLTAAIAGYTSRRVLPHVHERGLRTFAILASIATALAVVMLILGVGIRTGGLG